MISNPIKNLALVRSVVDDRGQVQERLVTGLGPKDTFSNQLQRCMANLIEGTDIQFNLCQQSGQWFPQNIIPPAAGNSSHQYIFGTLEVTLDNIQKINLPDNLYQVTNFRNAYQEVIATATPKICADKVSDMFNKNNKIVIFQIGIKFKYKVTQKDAKAALVQFINSTFVLKDHIQSSILRKFKILDKEEQSPTKSYILGYFEAIKPAGEITHKIETVVKDQFIEIHKDKGESLGTYGFTELNFSGSYADCSNLGYLLNAAVDTVIFRARPFMTMAAGYELRKKQVEIFTELLKLKIDDECNPTDPAWLSTHDIYYWCEKLCVELVKEWIAEPYSLKGPDPLVFELFKVSNEEELAQRLQNQSDFGSKSIVNQLLSRITKIHYIPNPSPMAKVVAFVQRTTDNVLLNNTDFIDTDELSLQYLWSLCRVFFWCSKYLFRSTYTGNGQLQNCSNYNTLLMMGDPGTGKSTVLNILKDLLDGMIVNRSSFQRPSIIFSSAIIYPEFNTQVLAQWPDIYKSKLEGAQQCIDVKFKDPLNILKNVPVIGDTNQEFPLKDLKSIDIEAFNRRIYCVRFNQRFTLGKAPAYTYNEFAKTLLGFYATLPEDRDGIYKLNLKDYDINQHVLTQIGDQFKQTKWYKYFWQKSRYNTYKNLYQSTECSVLVNDEVRGSKFNPFPSQYREFTLSNNEVIQFMKRQDDEIQQEVINDLSQFESLLQQEITDALTVPKVLDSNTQQEINSKLDSIFTDDYYELLVDTFLRHCGSIKNKDDLQQQLYEYFRDQQRESLPQNDDEMNKMFEEQDFRDDVLIQLKEFNNAKSICQTKDNRRNKKMTDKQDKKDIKLAKQYGDNKENINSLRN